MKKFYFLMALMLGALSATAQNFNLFSASDVDSDGWLWFDSQAKIDKYVGVCNEEDYKADLEGKKVQMVYADQQPTYPAVTADPTVVGYGKGGEIGAEGAKTGGLILPPASAPLSTNGGGILIMMPSCATFSMNVSCGGVVSAQVLSEAEATKIFSEYEVRKAYSMFNKFASAGNVSVNGLEKVTNGYNDITIKSDNPVYVYFLNLTTKDVIVHGIKVITTTENKEEGVVTPPADEAASAVKFAAEASDAERTITVGLNAPGKVSVDWGDGAKVDADVTGAYDPVYDEGTVNITGKVKGEVKVYADGLVYFEATSRVDGAGLTSIDLTNATGLQKLFLAGNKLESIDLSKNVALTRVDILNNKLTSLDLSKNTELDRIDLSNNQISALDLSCNAKLTYLKISDNKFAGALDLTACPNLKSIYALNMEITDVTLGQITASKPYFSFNNNKLTSFDASELDCLSTGSLFLMGNQIKSFTMPKGGKIKTLNLSKNCMTLETLPLLSSGFTYAPQADLEVAESYNVNDAIDLSAQTNETLATTFALVKGDGTALVEGTDYTVADGKVTVLTPQESAYITLTSAKFSKFTGSNIFKTTKFVVACTPSGIDEVEAEGAVKVLYNIAGQRVNGSYKGIAVGSDGKKYVVK